MESVTSYFLPSGNINDGRYDDRIVEILNRKEVILPKEGNTGLFTEEGSTAYKFDLAYTDKIKVSVIMMHGYGIKYGGPDSVTIKSKGKWENRSMMDDLKDGQGSTILYAWLGDNGRKIEWWIIIDINKLRPHLEDAYSKEEDDDEGTEYYHYSIGQLIHWKCIIATSF